MAGGRVVVRAAGVEQVQAAIRAVNQAKDREIRRQLYAGLNRAAKPMVEAARANASTLPSSGGRGVRGHRLVGARKGVAQLVAGDLVTSGRVRDSEGRLRRVESVADRVRAARFAVRAKGGRSAAIRIVVTPSKGKSLDLNSLDRGRLRHPLFGNRDHWYSQAVPPGWFTAPMRSHVDGVRREVLRAVDEVVRQLAGRG